MHITNHASLTTLSGFLVRLFRFAKTRRARIIAIIALVLFVLFTVIGFFLLPPYVKQVAVVKLSEQLGRRVSIESVKLNPYSLAATIRGLEIKEDDGRTPFVSFKSLYVNLKVNSVFKGGPVLSEIKLEQPYVHIVRTGSNTYNFSDIANKILAGRTAAVQEKPGKPLFFSLSNIQLVDGYIEFDDQPAATKHIITQINISIPFISDFPS